MKAELLLSIVLAMCTAAYTIINFCMLLENKRIRKQKITPFLIAYLKSSDNHSVLELIIENIGEGPAQNVKATLNKDYNQFGQKGSLLSNQGLFKNGFNDFPPNYKLKYFIHCMTEIDFNSKDSQLLIELTYNRIDGKRYSQTYELTFSQVSGQNYSTPPETYIGQIPYYLNEISRLGKTFLEYIRTHNK